MSEDYGYITHGHDGDYAIPDAVLGDALMGRIPNGDYAIVQLDAEARVVLARKHAEAIERIEAKLDVLLSALPERPCTPERGDHIHGVGPAYDRPLRNDEAPYPNCYGFDKDDKYGRLDGVGR